MFNGNLNMKKQYIAACLAGIVTLGFGTGANADVVFQNDLTSSGTGNQSGFDLGMSFNVACPMTVTSLGTFDNNLAANNGDIAASLGTKYESSDHPIDVQVAIYNVATGTAVTPIVDFTLAGAASYFSSGASIFQTISSVTLQPGKYMIAASGYSFSTGGGFLSGNTTIGNPSHPTPLFDTLGGALTLSTAAFSGSQMNGGLLPLAFPTTADPTTETPATGPIYLAGTFNATCNCGSTPDGGTTIGLLGLALTGIAGLSRKFKK